MPKLECQSGNWPDWERQKPEEPRIRRPNAVSEDFWRANLSASGHSSEEISATKQKAVLKAIWVVGEEGAQQPDLEVGR